MTYTINNYLFGSLSFKTIETPSLLNSVLTFMTMSEINFKLLGLNQECLIDSTFPFPADMWEYLTGKEQTSTGDPLASYRLTQILIATFITKF